MTWLMGFASTTELAILGSVPAVAAVLFFRAQKRSGKRLDPLTHGIKYLAISVGIAILIALIIGLVLRSF